MLINSLFLLLGLGILVAGAEAFVRGSSALGRRFGLSASFIGLTIVAFGTSSPELFVSLKAALANEGDIATANVIGSNTFNIGIILGLTAIICPIAIRHQMVRIDSPIMIAVALLIPFVLLDKQISRLEGGLFLIGLIAYVVFSFRLAKRCDGAGDSVSSAPELPKLSLKIALVLTVCGLALLVVGSNLLIENARDVARALSVSETVIGLTIVAAGTSLPELATSILAAIKREPDIAVGNVVGSNIFNILGILGIASVAKPISAPEIQALDWVVMIVLSIALLIFQKTDLKLHRAEGLFLIAAYGSYLYLLWPK